MPKGPDHPGWKGGISIRNGIAAHAVSKAIRQRIKEVGICQRCGATKRLHGHHPGDDPFKILVLCAPCHAAEHPKQAAMLS